METSAAGCRRVDGNRITDGCRQRTPQAQFGLQCNQLGRIRAAHVTAGDGCRLKKGILAPRDRREMKDRVSLDAAVIAEELAVRALILDMPLRAQVALQNAFRIGGHEQIVGHALHDRHGRAAQLGHQLQFVARRAHRTGEVIDGMRAKYEAHR